MARLLEGSKFKVHGFIMLAGLNDGQTYTIKNIEVWYGIDVYRITNKHNTIVVHPVEYVDTWLRHSDTTDLNWIERIPKGDFNERL